MTQTENRAEPKMSRKMKAVLIGSLALNLLVAGVFVGGVMRHAGPYEARGHSDLLVRVLDKDDRRAIGKAVKEAQGGGRRAFWAGQKAALGDVAAALRAEPYDGAAMQAALMRKSAHMSQTRNAAEAAMLARFETMSAAQRAALAARLESAMARGPKKD
ncbi:periplasmic heavy metal sensor [Lentibacter sp.]|uniref:periplasmic heavy metal sensor n=1 Tax=Lentibacter sp. TaxID=2024994 RepID=UPI003F69B811